MAALQRAIGIAMWVALLPTGLCHAEDGTMDMLFGGLRKVSSVDMGGTLVTAAGGNGTITITRSSSATLPEGLSGMAECAMFAKRSANAFELEADCALTFSPQDKLYVVFRRKTGDLTAESAGQGVEQLLGGTGRFAGISGQCAYEVQNFAGDWNVTTSHCKWSR